MPLDIGHPFPEFMLESTDGPVSLHDLRGKKIVMFFYPADNTPTCTKEACNFRDAHADFRTAGVIVFGVSPNDIKSHNKFRAKYKLPYPLLFDEGHKLASELGLWVKKSLFGVKYMGLERTTIVIDTAGKVAAIFPKVRVKEHHTKVLEAVLAAG